MKAQVHPDPVTPLPNRALVWLWPVLGLVALAGQFGLQAAGCPGMLNLSVRQPTPAEAVGLLNIAGLGFLVVGLLIAIYRTENRFSRLSSLIGLLLLVLLFCTNYVACGLQDPLKLPLVNLSAWFTVLLLWVVGILFFVILPMLFPDGQFPSPGWRRFTQGALAILAFALLITLIWPEPNILFDVYGLQELANPVALQFVPTPFFNALVHGLMPGLMVLASVAAIVSQIQRWRHSTGEARQQLKWFAYFLAITGLISTGLIIYGVLIDRMIFQTWLYYAVVTAWWIGFPILIGIAILKYRLFDIDIIIHRTLVYTALSAVLLAIYFACVIAFQELFQLLTGQHQSSIATVLSTLAIAALFNPLRKRIQGGIDHRFFRRRYNAEKTLQALADTLRDEVDLDKMSSHLVAVVRETMQPESVSLWLKDQGKRRSRVG